jgi:hypothetical protein
MHKKTRKTHSYQHHEKIFYIINITKYEKVYYIKIKKTQ